MKRSNFKQKYLKTMSRKSSYVVSLKVNTEKEWLNLMKKPVSVLENQDFSLVLESFQFLTAWCSPRKP